MTLCLAMVAAICCIFRASIAQAVGDMEPLSSSPIPSPSSRPEPPAPRGRPTRGECRGQDAGDKLRVGIKSRAGSAPGSDAGCRVRAARGDRLVVHYEGRFYSDCTVFDSTRPSIVMKTNDYDPNADIESSSGISGKSRGSGSSNSKLGGASSYKHSAVERGPFTFVLGEGTLIRGWEEGLVGMCVGEVRKLTIPRSMAYTRYADSEDNPMSKGLVYEIELLELYKAE